MEISYDRLVARIDELIYELALIRNELNGPRNRICNLESEVKEFDKK